MGEVGLEHEVRVEDGEGGFGTAGNFNTRIVIQRQDITFALFVKQPRYTPR